MLLDKTKKMIHYQNVTNISFNKKSTAQTGPSTRGLPGITTTGFGHNTTSFLDNEEDDLLQQDQQFKKIGPFSFDMDDDIDTEVLTNDEVFRDLKDLEGILDKDKDKVNISTRMLGRNKKKTHR